MNMLLPIASSDMDVIIGIIAVVGWILSQVLSRKKGGDPTAPSHGEPTPPPLDPQDELRRFFEEMKRSVSPPEEPVKKVVPPPPVMRAQPQPKRERPANRIRKQEEPRPSVLSTPAYVSSSPMLNEPEPQFTLPVTLPTARSVSLLMPEIRDPVALRKMIITMEVLGKPVALRNGNPVL